MQHVERPAHVQPLSQPPGESRARVEPEPLRGVLRPQRPHGVSGHRRQRRHFGQLAPVRSPELEGPIGLTLNLIALLVHRAVMPATE